MLDFPQIEAHPLKGTLQAKGISQVQLARYLGKSLSSVAAWLNGYRPAPPEIQRKLDELQKQMEIEL